MVSDISDETVWPPDNVKRIKKLSIEPSKAEKPPKIMYNRPISLWSVVIKNLYSFFLIKINILVRSNVNSYK